MYPALPHGQTVTLRYRVVTGQDEYNNDVYSSTDIQVGPCSVQQATSREIITGFTDQVSTGVIVFMPYGTDVNFLDAVVINGIVYEVTGDPESWTSPFSGRVAPVRVSGLHIKGASP